MIRIGRKTIIAGVTALALTAGASAATAAVTVQRTRGQLRRHTRMLDDKGTA